METLDMSKVLMAAYQLADDINDSEEVNEYLACKKKMDNDPEAQKLIREFQQVKELYHEAQRFGIFHPDYHKAKEKALAFQEKLRVHPTIGAFLQAEEKLDELLSQVSLTLAHAISPSIKVPTNRSKLQKNKLCDPYTDM